MATDGTVHWICDSCNVCGVSPSAVPQCRRCGVEPPHTSIRLDVVQCRYCGRDQHASNIRCLTCSQALGNCASDVVANEPAESRIRRDLSSVQPVCANVAKASSTIHRPNRLGPNVHKWHVPECWQRQHPVNVMCTHSWQPEREPEQQLTSRERALSRLWEAAWPNIIANFYTWITFGRRIRVYAYREDELPDHLVQSSVRVHIHGEHYIDARSTLYPISDVTGINLDVQAVVVSQENTARVLKKAIMMIEDGNLKEFAFVCHGGTHRSVACACLLIVVAYPESLLVTTTRRTAKAAMEAMMTNAD